MTSLLHPMISVARWDFTTCLPIPPLSLTRGKDPGPWSNMPRGFPQWISIASPGASSSGCLRRLARRDIAVGAHTHVTVCTQVLNSSHHRLT
jgi:hypothetical protein